MFAVFKISISAFGIGDNGIVVLTVEVLVTGSKSVLKLSIVAVAVNDVTKEGEGDVTVYEKDKAPPLEYWYL